MNQVIYYLAWRYLANYYHSTCVRTSSPLLRFEQSLGKQHAVIFQCPQVASILPGQKVSLTLRRKGEIILGQVHVHPLQVHHYDLVLAVLGHEVQVVQLRVVVRNA